MDHAIWAEGLVKRFGETTALSGVDLSVRTGTVLGLLGPNGAGKTTAVRVLATLLQPDAGHAEVGGYDVVRDGHRVRQLIGLTGQYASVDETLTGSENLVMIGRLLGIPRVQAKQRARELLADFGLTEAAHRAAKTYSGGMLLLAFALAFSWVSVLVGVLAKDPERVQIFGFTALFPITFVSNVFVPAETMPGWLEVIVNANPVSILADACRGLMLGEPYFTGSVARPVIQSLLWAAAIAVVFAPLSVRALKRRV